MAGSQEQVQEYLQKHKIGNLFEELMAKVVSDMPGEPIVYMIQTLERKAARSGNKSFLRRSMGDLGGISVAKDRAYERPWQTNTKRQKNKKPGETLKKGIDERPEWDNKAKLKPSTFDDFWEESGKPSRPGTAPEKTKNQSSWADDAEHEDLLYSCQSYGGPRRPYDGDSDPLAGEFSLIQQKETQTQKSKYVSSGRYKGPKAKAEKHRHALKEIINKRQQQADSGIEEDGNQYNDTAIEMMEDADALIAEGAKHVKRTGVRVRHANQEAKADPSVKISICGRCAKVMTGVNVQQSEPISAIRVSPGLTSDDEFESVSQVTGPRRPVWGESDSDDDPLQSRRTYTAQDDAKGKVDMRSTVSDARDLEGARSSPLKGHVSFSQTWSPDSQLTPDRDEVNEDYESAATSLQGSGWGRPPPTEPTDYESDISMPVRKGSKGTLRKYQGQF